MFVDIRKIRRENLLRLVGDGKHSDFADMAGISASHLSQIFTNKTNVGNNLARKIETNLGIKPYELDGIETPEPSKVDPARLSEVLEGMREAVDGIGYELTPKQFARLAARMYSIWDATGVMPNFAQFAQAEAMREEEKR